LVKNAWQPGRGYAESFAIMMTSLLGRYGLIFLDPLDPELKKLAAPLYAEAAQRASEIAAAIEKRSSDLESAGYHAQVLATSNSFPLFLHDEQGARHAVGRIENGKYKTKDIEQEYTAEELAALALEKPERFSPNVTRIICCRRLHTTAAPLRSLTSRRLPKSIAYSIDQRRRFCRVRV
jgi:uncharacterized protein YllA (UPF0747 family)